ncbi:MAG: hypothetical protein KDB22_11105 [Planctomycetales bacterium]|nr:hypothetical protein [Planctomycetales bacterium]
MSIPVVAQQNPTSDQKPNDLNNSLPAFANIKRIYSLRFMEAEQARKIVSAFNSNAGLSVAAEQATNALVVMATVEQHNSIADLIASLDTQAPTGRVVAIELTNLALDDALFIAVKSFEHLETPPTIVADQSEELLRARGAPEQLRQLRNMLSTIDAIMPVQVVKPVTDTHTSRHPASRAELERFFPSMALAEAVKQFNEKAARDAIGRQQPALTQEEVVLAIEEWDWESAPNTNEEMYGAFVKVAESGQLPAGAHLSFTTDYGIPNKHMSRVWWIDLNLPLDEEETGYLSYSFRIRKTDIGE